MFPWKAFIPDCLLPLLVAPSMPPLGVLPVSVASKHWGFHTSEASCWASWLLVVFMILVSYVWYIYISNSDISPELQTHMTSSTSTTQHVQNWTPGLPLKMWSSSFLLLRIMRGPAFLVAPVKRLDIFTDFSVYKLYILPIKIVSTTSPESSKSPTSTTNPVPRCLHFLFRLIPQLHV
jgi:hypothetical protein